MNAEQNSSEAVCIHCGKPLKNKRSIYCTHQCQQKHQTDKWIQSWLSNEMDWSDEKNQRSNIPDRIRHYMFEENNYKCSVCGWTAVNPYTGTIPLEVDHIDGNYFNNSHDNLRVLCPNCHSLTRTYRGANHKNRNKYIINEEVE